MNKKNKNYDLKLIKLYFKEKSQFIKKLILKEFII